MTAPRPEHHLHDDLSLSPAYVLGYAFHALGRIDETTPAHGRLGVVALVTELLATMAALELDASLAAAEPLRVVQKLLSHSRRSARIGPASAAQVITALAMVEVAVRSELRARSDIARTPSGRASFSLRVLLREAALARCPEELRWEVTEACLALDAHLYTAAVFHAYRVWEQLPGPAMLAPGELTCLVADPRRVPALRCSRAEAVNVLGAVNARLER
jgi:hypothetical protein